MPGARAMVGRQGSTLRASYQDRVTNEARGSVRRGYRAGSMQVGISSRRYSSLQAVGGTLDYADLFVELLDESERDLVLRPTVGSNPVPMTIDRVGEFLVRLEPLPLEGRTPVLEEAPCPALAFIAPQLAKILLENVGGVEPLVGCQQGLQRLPALQGEVLLARQLCVFLAFDVAPLATLKLGILALANRIQGLAQMANDMELVE